MNNFRRVCSVSLVASLIVSTAFISLRAAEKKERSHKSKTPDTQTTRKRILFFSKSSGFEHSAIKQKDHAPSYVEEALKRIAETNNFEFVFTSAKDGSAFTKENIAKYDAFFFYTTGDLTEEGTDHNLPMSIEGKALFLDAIAHGKGFVGVHSSSDTFHSPGGKDHGPERYQLDGDKADPYVKMLGAEFIRHGSQQPGHLICTDKTFPGCENFPTNFAPTEEWYSLKNFATNLHVILAQDTSMMKTEKTDMVYKRPNYPETWARMHGQGRVFYSSMGHREDIWTNPVFQKVLVGGINWAVRNIDADVTPNIQQVTPQANVMPPMK